MSEEKAIVILDPKSELHFKGPTTEILTCQLKLTNPGDRRICFKVKTTAPKRYCVRPNNGIVEAKTTATILVMLQPYDADATQNSERFKHKFMVQTCFAPDGEVDLDSVWKHANPEAITDSKLRCVFDHVAALDSVAESQQQVSSNATAATEQRTSLGTSVLVSRGRSEVEDDEQAMPAPKGGSTTSTGSPKAAHHSPKSTGDDTSDPKLLEENKKLRLELRKVRQENMQMKEDGCKQRILMSGNSAAGVATAADLLAQQKLMGRDVSVANGQQEIVQLLMNPNVLAIALVLFVVGVVVGKVLF